MMEKNQKILLGILAVMIIVNTNHAVSQEENIIRENNITIIAEFNIYSGIHIPDWTLSVEEIKDLKIKLNNLPQSEPINIPEFGYVLIKNENNVFDFFPYRQIYAFCPTYITSDHVSNSLIVINDVGEKKYYQDTNNLCEWLIQSGKEHDPNYIPSQSIPSNTPRIGIATLSLFRSNATVKQNTYLSLPFIAIFSEGTATLEGTISTPDFITIDKDSFSKPPHSGGEDFTIEVDTSEPREIIGDIVIKSNDPDRSEIKIPVHYIILGNKVTSNESANITPNDKVIKQEHPEPNYNLILSIAIILITIILSLIMIWYRKFNQNKS